MTLSRRAPAESLVVDALQSELGIGDGEWAGVVEAARDCHLEPRAYCRLMVLCAAGFGGVLEHAQRAVDASFDADHGGMKIVVKGKR